MSKPKAVVCASGGMDSLVTAAIAALDHEVYPLHVSYGQRTRQREYRAFCAIAEHLDCDESKRLVVDIAHLARIGGSSLTDHALAVETGLADDHAGIPSTYVPFRNANILAAAVSWAEVLGAEAVYIGVTEEDSAGYPDCRRTFLDAFEQAANLGTKPDTSLRIVSPLVDLAKADIVHRGLDLAVPFELSWSCYTASVTACGRCDSCRRRLRAFRLAGADDPLPYAHRDEAAP